jgi:hypothetical protein
MPRRLIVVDGKEYAYVIGRRLTKVDGVGSKSNSDIGDCVDVSMDKYRVTPKDVANFIRSETYAQSRHNS